MYLRQHPTYRRLSTRFANKSRPYSHSDEVYQTPKANYYAASNHQGQRNGVEHFASSNEGSADEPQLTSRDFINWERIGRGGFGKVYRAQPRDSQLYSLAPDAQGFVAIKVVDKRALKDSAAELRLATEVAVHESLAHPSVVHIYDSFEDDRFVYLVMEYCERTDLWRYLRQRHMQLTGDSPSRKPHSQKTSSGGELAALSESETRYVIKQVAAAVAYLHSNGVLHRDLKLANILLSRNMVVKVGDFGLATRIDDSMEPTTMCGTPSYISPEIMARQPYGFESDIWALGCLMVTLLTGTHPFRGINRITEDVVARINLPRAVSSETRSLVYSLLRIDPRQRIRSQELVSHPFFGSLLSTVRLPTLAQLKQKMDNHRGGGPLEGRDGIFNDGKYADRILPPRHPDLRVDGDDGGARRLAFHGGNGRRNAYGYSDNEEQYQPKHMDRHRSGSIEVPQTEYFNNRPQSIAVGVGYRNRGPANSAEIRGDRYYSQAATAAALNEDGMSRQASKAPATEAPASVDLDTYTTRRLPPLKRAMKNGKVYLRADHLLVLDLTTVPTIVAMNEQLKEIYEFKRPLHIEALCPEAAYRIYAWDLDGLPERVSKTVRMACRCVSFLRSQQKRIKITTSQGKGWLFEDAPQATFKFNYFNGIKVELSRKRLEAVVEIPSKQDMPNEIQKIALAAHEFPVENNALHRGRGGKQQQQQRNVDELALDLSDMSLNQKNNGDFGNAKIPGKVKGILDHAKESLRRVLDFDGVLRSFEEGGTMCGQFEGEMQYPVELSWDWDITADLDYVPPGLQRRTQVSERQQQQQMQQPGMLLAGRGLSGRASGALRQSAMPISINTAGSTTVISSLANNRAARHANNVLSRAPAINEQPEAEDDYSVVLDSPPMRNKRQRGNHVHGSHEQQQQQWGAHVLDQRTVNDTPTRRLNLGPITRLVEEFNKTSQPTPLARTRLNNLLKTPGTVLRTPMFGDMAFALAQQTFQGACFIPDVGWCMAAEGKDADDYAITILFCDGCRILVKVKDQVATYKDAAAEYADLPFDHAMPTRVKERLTWLPQFLGLMGLGI
ncbi:hypothetical protein LPJ59_001363 [Coemansia sp. RSA 2399]|nr:hypothetical protein LPJ59_001363 [Coemansia sp. RSA 2399]KAJ1906716.1 hypothetical protein LPJ81_001202 [Coemansia sp. IMI 209127]